MNLEDHKACRWLDPGKYFYWEGDMLRNDRGEFLMAKESKKNWQLIAFN